MNLTDSVITLGERLDVGTVDRQWKILEAAIVLPSVGRIVADASGVRMCDSSGLRLLINLQRRAEAARKHLVIFKPGESLLEILTDTKLIHVFTIVNTLDADVIERNES